ncbi:6747_t:CDS:1, partial [Paraglomus occultum]
HCGKRARTGVQRQESNARSDALPISGSDQQGMSTAVNGADKESASTRTIHRPYGRDQEGATTAINAANKEGDMPTRTDNLLLMVVTILRGSTPFANGLPLLSIPAWLSPLQL